MSGLRTFLFWTTLFAACPALDAAEVPIAVESRFDSSDEGWKVVELADTFGAGPYRRVVRGPHTPQYRKSGELFFLDIPGHTFYFSAPEKFLGNLRDAYGSSIRFDLRALGPPPGEWYFEPDVILTGTNGLVLASSLYIEPIQRYRTFEIPMMPIFWGKENYFGPSPTAEEFLSVLGGLKSLWIRGEYFSGDDGILLDNVRVGLNGGIPRRAIGQVQTVNGFVVQVDLLDGGFGFQSPPTIEFVDPSGLGSGATAAARVEDGWLVEIEMINAGRNYSEDTMVIIGPPPRPPRIDVYWTSNRVELQLNVWADHRYRLESSQDLETWETVWERTASSDQPIEQIPSVDSTRFHRLIELE